MAELSSTRDSGTDRALLGAVIVLAVAAAVGLWWTTPEHGDGAPHALRATGGILCMAAVVVAATATAHLRSLDRHIPFISEVLAACRGGRFEPRWDRGLGSLVACALMLFGAMVFLLDALRLDGAQRIAVIATGLCLIAVVVEPLRAAHPTTAPPRAFLHPAAAASFYIAALVLSLIERDSAGPIARVAIAIHVASSSALIAIALISSVREYGWTLALRPVAGLRILLDVRADSRARWVRYTQWWSTVLAGGALCAGALGV